MREVSRNIDSPYKGRQRKASPVKAQYEDFKVKFGITAEHDSVVSMSPDAKKSKLFLTFRKGNLPINARTVQPERPFSWLERLGQGVWEWAERDVSNKEVHKVIKG